MLFYILALSILIIDQFIKQLVQSLMYLGQSVPLLGGFLKLTYVQNTGAAFSLFVGFSSYLAIIGIVVVIIVIYLYHRIPARRFWVQTALAFILGGSLGNLMDRFFRFYVIDYLDVGFWPVFNFADIMINLGVLLFIIYFFEEEVEEIKEKKEERKMIIKELEHVSDTD